MEPLAFLLAGALGLTRWLAAFASLIERHDDFFKNCGSGLGRSWIRGEEEGDGGNGMAVWAARRSASPQRNERNMVPDLINGRPSNWQHADVQAAAREVRALFLAEGGPDVGTLLFDRALPGRPI
jgi:hypothetical protein